MARKPKGLSSTTKYVIADTMAKHFDSLRTVSRDKAFGVVMNAPVKFNGVQSTLKAKFPEEEAIHITNLVLRRVYGTDIAEVDI